MIRLERRMEVCRVAVLEGLEERVVVIQGELDVAGASKVDAVSSRAVNLIVDVRGITFVDAAGIGALLRLLADARAAGKTSAWRGRPSSLMRILAILGMAD